MFTGLVEAKAKVIKVTTPEESIEAVDAKSRARARVHSPDGLFLEVEKPLEFNDLKKGDSVAVNGICLSLVNDPTDSLKFCLGAETLKVLGEGLHPLNWKQASVNLERPMKLGERLHGHIVSGHVDAVAEIVNLEVSVASGWRLTLKLEKQWEPFLWPKGSVTVMGVSLTVNSVDRNEDSVFFQVGLIPETLEKTNLGLIKPGSFVTVEMDWMAKMFSNMIFRGKETPFLKTLGWGFLMKDKSFGSSPQNNPVNQIDLDHQDLRRNEVQP